MQIECTRKLLDFLKKAPSPADKTVDPFYAWSAHFMVAERRKTLLVMNNVTLCGFAIHGLTAAVQKKLDQLIPEGIRRTLLFCRIDPALIEDYMSDAGNEVSFTSSRDRSVIGILGNLVSFFDCNKEIWIPGELFQLKAMEYCCAVPHRRNEYMRPIDSMQALFAQYYGEESACACDMAVLNITLEDMECSRQVRIPLDFTLYQVRHVIHRIFEWKDIHMHEFCDQDDMNLSMYFPQYYPKTKRDPLYEDDERMECMVSLREALAKVPQLQYIYDFGTCWTHWIKLVRIEKGSEDVKCCCTLAMGDAPPECVSGPDDFREFCQIIKDPKHPQYPYIKGMADTLRWSPLDMKKINLYLKDL